MKAGSAVSIDKAQLAERPIRVVVPADVAFNLGKLQKALGSLAERLGCKPCLSGRSCFFQLERDFVVNPQSLDVESVAGGIVIHG